MILNATGITAKAEATLLTETYGRFVVEPLESGFGVTLGNAMRRVLLGSIPGAAVTSMSIEGLEYEFSTIPYMKEDTIEFILNVKELRLRHLSDRPGRLILEVDGEGEVAAADIVPSADYEIVNPELHLATLDSPEARLYVEFSVEQGKGYVPANHIDNRPIGTIPVDAIFTPIRRVNFTVERTRVGQLTNYDKLTLDVWTDGTIGPQEAVSKAAEILVEELAIFVYLGQPLEQPLDQVSAATMALTNEQYNTPIKSMGLSVRTNNCLQRGGITTLGQIAQMTEGELLAVKNFGRKSLDEVRSSLAALGLSLAGAKVPEVEAEWLDEVTEVTIEEDEALVVEQPEELLASLIAPSPSLAEAEEPVIAPEDKVLEPSAQVEAREAEPEQVGEAATEEAEAISVGELEEWEAEESEDLLSPIALALARAMEEAAASTDAQEAGDDDEQGPRHET